MRMTVMSARMALGLMPSDAEVVMSHYRAPQYDQHAIYRASANGRVALARFRKPLEVPRCPRCHLKRVGTHFESRGTHLVYECFAGHQWDAIGRMVTPRVKWHHER